MTVTLNIAPEVEADLLAEARSAGLPLDQFISRHLESLAQTGTPRDRTRGDEIVKSDHWGKEFDEWLDSFPQSPVLSEEALKRENWYQDRW